MLNGTTTRSPRLSRRTDGPTSSIVPVNSWPKVVPTRVSGTRPWKRCRSEPQIAARLTRTIASSGCSMRGSGLSRTRTRKGPSYTSARILLPPPSKLRTEAAVRKCGGRAPPPRPAAVASPLDVGAPRERDPGAREERVDLGPALGEDRAREVVEDDRLEAVRRGVHRARPDAEVAREAADEHPPHAPCLQPRREARARPPAVRPDVLAERAVRVHLAARPLAQQERERGVREPRVERRATRTPHAVVRPELLPSLRQLQRLERLLPWVGRGEGHVPGRMQVLRRDDRRERGRERRDGGDDGVALRHGQRPA